MAKLWSISTTLRSPERILEFLKILKKLENNKWNKENQMKFQILLIQYREYKPLKKGLSDTNINILDDVFYKMSFEEAKNIFDEKEYQDPPMRGRTSFSPLKELGLAYIDKNNNIKISKVGNMLLEDKLDFEEFFIKWALKWQYPNPITNGFNKGYNISPLIGTIKLILLVNKKWAEMGSEPVGISKNEFSIFALSLINISDVEKWADKLIKFRLEYQATPFKDKQKFYHSYIKENLVSYSNASLKNIKDYSDNAIRYFSLTNLLKKRGNGYYIDIVPTRMKMIKKLFKTFDGSSRNFKLDVEYTDYLNDLTFPNIEFHNEEVKENYINEISSMIKENKFLNESPNLNIMSFQELIDYRKKLLFKMEKNDYQDEASITNLINKLEKFRNQDIPPSLALEKLVSSSLIALNDAIEIKPNYSSDDDNNIIFTAPAGKPDIECYYDDFNAICEVTTLTSRDQWYNEGQPVMRHLKDFIIKNDNKKTYCLFIAPKIHQDTLNTYWYAVKYEYEGSKLFIIPFSLKRFEEIIYAFRKLKKYNKSFTKTDLQELYNKVCEVDNISSSTEWWKHINETFEEWKNNLLNF